jgi:hypothetical protein
MKGYKALLMALSFLSLPLLLFGLGKKDGGKIPEGPILTEEAFETTVYAVGEKNEAPNSVRQKALGPGCAAYFFTEFKADKKTVQTSGNRVFSMTIVTQGEGSAAGDIVLYPFAMNLSPDKPLAYIPGKTVSVRFPLADVSSKGKGSMKQVFMQPSQKALSLGILESGWSAGLARVKSLSVAGDRVEAQIELAYPQR